MSLEIISRKLSQLNKVKKLGGRQKKIIRQQRYDLLVSLMADFGIGNTISDRYSKVIDYDDMFNRRPPAPV
jgi:hypothetical protein